MSLFITEVWFVLIRGNSCFIQILFPALLNLVSLLLSFVLLQTETSCGGLVLWGTGFDSIFGTLRDKIFHFTFNCFFFGFVVAVSIQTTVLLETDPYHM
jgi:hypothetical protein